MTSEKLFNAYFVDLFVRVSNLLAIQMYTAFGYNVYRVVLGKLICDYTHLCIYIMYIDSYTD